MATLPVLADRGIEPVIAAPPRGELAEQVQQMGFPWIPLSVPGSNMSQAERRERIAALIAKVRPDLLHANSTAIARLSGPVSGWQSVPRACVIWPDTFACWLSRAQRPAGIKTRALPARPLRFSITAWTWTNFVLWRVEPLRLRFLCC